MLAYIIFWTLVLNLSIFIWANIPKLLRLKQKYSENIIRHTDHISKEAPVILPVEQPIAILHDEQPLTSINVDGVPNFRGFGGYPIAHGKEQQTRRRLLYRSAHPGGLSFTGIQRLKTLGVKTIVNLASHNEATVPWEIPRKTVESEGFMFLDWPIERDSFSIDQLLRKYESYKIDGAVSVSENYLRLLVNGSDVIRRIFLLLKDANEGVLIHCTLGKDRTGMVFAVFLLLAEVPDAVIIREYGFSTSELSGYVERVEKYLKKVTKIHDEAIKRKAEDIVSAREENMAVTINTIRTVYGTIGNYLTQECGFSDEEVHLFRSLLLYPASR